MRFTELKPSGGTIHIVYSPSNLLELTLLDYLTVQWGVDKDDFIRVSSGQKVAALRKTLMLSAMNSDRWLVHIDGKRLKGSLKNVADLVRIGLNTSVFFIPVENYAGYKELKKLLDGIDLDLLYLSWLGEDEIGWLVSDAERKQAKNEGVRFLHNKYVSEKAQKFLQNGYRFEPGKVMDLCERVKNGETFPDRKSVINAVGVSAGSTDKMVFDLLKGHPKNTKLVMKNRLTTLYELAGVFGPRRTQSYLRATVRKIIDLKMLWLNGKVYKKIPLDLPEPYEYLDLKRYGRYLDVIEATPLERLVHLYSELDKGYWLGEVDIQRFIYGYYTEVLV